MHGGTRGIRNLARSPDTCCLFPLVACCLCREQQEARLRGLSELQGTAECPGVSTCHPFPTRLIKCLCGRVIFLRSVPRHSLSVGGKKIQVKRRHKMFLRWDIMFYIRMK
ncbi:hypothetical protein CDAR_8921 [Caerostris darwini]|uniref:Secreted protein n=1 Tax=Caerostris darwini TaxID=1538125 RepID=A0AAV4R1V1_9ARAC|nr:hypothetical protein CDAR_8921 [Caerostris darwini]